MLGAGMQPQARSVAFATIVATQLAQTLDVGRSEGTLTRPVVGAVAGSLSVLAAAFTIPPLRSFLHLVQPAPLGWLLIGGGSLLAVLLSRILASSKLVRPAMVQLSEAPATQLAPVEA
jgi:hypothetical protein